MSRARLIAVESLGEKGKHDSHGPKPKKHVPRNDAGTHTEKTLHHLVLLLSALCAAFRQLHDHAHVTCSQDGLHSLDELVEQPEELRGHRETRDSLQSWDNHLHLPLHHVTAVRTSLYLAEAAVSLCMGKLAIGWRARSTS